MNLTDEQLEALKQIPEAMAIIEPKPDRWEPEGGDFWITSSGCIENDGTTNSVKNFGMERPTKELAEKHLDRLWLFNRIAAYVDEHAPDYEPDWDSAGFDKFFIYFSHSHEVWCIDSVKSQEIASIVYMPKHIAEQLLADIKSGRFATKRDQS